MITIEIQPTFTEVIQDVKFNKSSTFTDQFWINFYDSLNSVEDGFATEEIIKVANSSTSENDLIFENDKAQFKETRIHDRDAFQLEYSGETYLIKPPRGQIQIPSNISITQLTVNPQKTQLSLGTDSGDIILIDLTTNESRVISMAHLNSITTLCYFPSGSVLLSVGLDYQIKLWDTSVSLNQDQAEDGKDLDLNPARIFTGHKKQITSVAMIDRGRNFLSGGKDGIVKLWDCASGECLFDFQRANSVRDVVTDTQVYEKSTQLQFVKVHEGEFGTENKTALIGYDSGVVVLWDLHSKKEIGVIPSTLSASVAKIVAIKQGGKGEEYIIAYSDGTISRWDLNHDKEKPVTQTRLNGKINAMQLVTGPLERIVVSYGSGFVVELNIKTLTLMSILAGKGMDCDVKFVTCSDDGEIMVGNSNGSIYRF
ncbi:hypothetical protein WICPIJ_009963 [Wickerhamomyces pijperi]|uniref:Anaphase-promoting complex subunit 4 WD40 domain-containing protein n=1 Tax=Wickerhamomyces pijperi TaxID=599730 RepID=A0A9P8PKA4_WICPI|nr:hypothetical protein WICPIJ_009963 [Wickerhamomyces pijperi]